MTRPERRDPVRRRASIPRPGDPPRADARTAHADLAAKELRRSGARGLFFAWSGAGDGVARRLELGSSLASNPVMTFRKSLCAIDFSECSRAAMRTAIELAEASGAPLTLMHVWNFPVR